MLILCNMIDNPADLSKFQRIYNRYHNTMYLVAYDILRNVHDAEDTVANSLIKVIGILNKIEADDIDRARGKNLMITIAKNTALDHKKRVENKLIPKESVEDYRLDRGAEDIYIDTENYKELIECINELDDKYRDVFRLKVLYELSSKEVGDLLSITEQNVNMRYMRAKAMLRQKLEERGIHG